MSSIDVDSNVICVCTCITATPIMTVFCGALHFGKSPRYNISCVWLQLPYVTCHETFFKVAIAELRKATIIFTMLSVS